MNRNLVQIISLLELLLLIILGILSNKVAELLQVNQTFLWVVTILVVAALVAITVHKNDPESNSSNLLQTKLDIRITKKTVGGVLTGIIYYPSALMLSKGAFAYSQAIDKNWFGILSGGAVSGVLLFALLLLNHVKEERQSMLPLTIGFLLSLIYGALVYILTSFRIFRF